MPDSDESENRRWTTYSDYEEIVEKMAWRVDNAINAHGHLTACHSQQISVTNNSAIQTKKALLSAGTRLKPEVRHNKDMKPFTEIWNRWEGPNGHVAQLRNADLITSIPPWLDQYVDDITRAAWELGYLKAGTEEPRDPDDDDTIVTEVIE